ncbi:phosphatase PAP2 family protein [Flaviaesturariibacter terrae]
MNAWRTIQLKAQAWHLSLRLLAIVGLFLVALLLFSVIANEMVIEQEARLDNWVFRELRPLQSAALTRVMLVVTFFGSAHFLLPAYLLLIGSLLLSKKSRRLSLDSAAIGIAGTILLFTFKSIFHRHRPPDPLVQNVLGFSFPSGHSFSSFTFYGLLIYLAWALRFYPWARWTIAVGLFLFSCAIAFSRVYLHVHYASDVVAGFLLCIIWLTLSFWIMERIDRKLRRKRTDLRVS